MGSNLCFAPGQELVKFFCKGPDGKYFGLCRPFGLLTAVPNKQSDKVQVDGCSRVSVQGYNSY